MSIRRAIAWASGTPGRPVWGAGAQLPREGHAGAFPLVYFSYTLDRLSCHPGAVPGAGVSGGMGVPFSVAAPFLMYQ